MIDLTPEQRTEVLKSIGQSITSYRRRLDHWDGPEATRLTAQESHDLLVAARTVIEGE